MAAKRKKRAAAKPAAKEKRTASSETSLLGKRQFGAIILFALGILFFFIMVYPGEAFWLFLHNLLMGCFSYAVAFVPVILIYTAIMLTMNRPFGAFGGKLVLSLLLLLEVCGLLHLFMNNPLEESGFALIRELYEGSVNFTYGGLFALPFGVGFELALGHVGAIITNIILALVTLLLLTGLTLMDALKLAKKPVEKIGEAYHNQVEANKEKKARFNVNVNIDDIPEQKGKSKKAAKEEAALPEENGTKNDPSPELEALIKAFSNEAAGEATATEPITDSPKEEIKTEEAAKEIEQAVKEQEQEEETKEAENTKPAYRFPPLSLLRPASAVNTGVMRKELEENGKHLVEVLESFGVSTSIIGCSRGPAVTRYELQPSAGVKISRITNLADDIALNLAASGVRIEAPIPGKAAVGIEIPNKTRSSVNLSEVLGSPEFKSAKSKLTVALGRDIAGKVALANIADMPHILIAGATGSGKSVCINTIIMSILYKSSPEDVRLLLVDPKVVELGVYNGIPHLLVPVVTDPKKASGALAWAVTEMMNRYKLFAETDTRNLKSYNEYVKKDDTRKPLPQIVIIIDELADLMMAAPGEVEDAICRLAQMARAAGMHLIIATQRPSVDVITGLIKANIPSRLSFAVTSQIDSRTILDGGGAEKLLGRGDMLFKPMGENKAQRIQGCFVSDAEIESVIDFLTNGEQAEYDEQIAQEIERLKATEKGAKRNSGGDDLPEDGDETDETFFKAIEVVIEAGQASTSLLQRRLKLGYARAARYIDMMDQRGIVGPFEGSKPRKVLISKEQFMEMTLNNTLPAPKDH